MTGRRFTATFYDGLTSQPHRVILDVQAGLLTFYPENEDFRERWKLAQISNFDEYVAGRALNLAYVDAPDQRLVVTDLEAIYALLKLLPSRNRSLVRVPVNVPVILGLVVACLAVLVTLPFVVKAAAVPLAHVIPVAWEKPLGPLLVPEMAAAREYALKQPCKVAAQRDEVARIVISLQKANHLDRPLEVLISPSSDINAYAMPGDIIFVNEGLLKFIESDNELAGILAHEMGHLHRRHVMETLLNSVGLRVVLAAMTGGSDQLARLGSAGAGLFELGYSRDHESEADQSAVDYLGAAKLHTDGLMEFLKRIEKKESLRAELGSHDFLTYLSTHPPLAARLEILEAGRLKKGQKAGHILTSAQFKRLKNPLEACPEKPD